MSPTPSSEHCHTIVLNQDPEAQWVLSNTDVMSLGN